MAAIAGPYGLRPVQLVGGLPFAGATKTYPLTANQTAAYYFGDPVGLVGGNVVPITATPTTTAGPNSPIGVFCGCEYEDNLKGFVNAQWLPANAVSAGLKKIKIKVCHDPSVVMMVQANGPVTADKLGLNAALTGIGTGSTSNGNSKVALDAASAAVAATLAVRIVGFPDSGYSVVGDAFTDVHVIWNAGVHRLSQGLGQ
jgi:hypothetical protein